MDLTIPIIGSIIALGYHFTESPKTPRQKKEVRTELSPNETPSGPNVYESKRLATVRQAEQTKANDNYLKASQFPNSNIVPAVLDSKTTRPPNTVVASVEQQTREQFERTKQSILNGPMFGNPYKTNTITYAEKGKSLLGGDVPSHQNMIPFFGSKVTQNTMNQTVNVVEKFTGADSAQKPKQEVQNFFKPQINTNVFGNQALTTRIDALERFGPSLSNNKTNLLPVHQVRVEPLPAELVKPKFRTIDQTRALSNLKQTFEGRTKIGADVSKFVRAEIGKVDKNRPDTMYENTPDRWFTTNAFVTKPKEHPGFDLSKSNTKSATTSTMFNLGPGVDTIKKEAVQYERFTDKPTFFTTTVLPDKKQSFTKDWERNLQKDVKTFDSSLFTDVFTHKENERDTTKHVPLSHAQDYRKGELVWYDKAKTTIKETNLFEYSGNAESIVPGPQDYFATYNTENTANKVLVENYIPSSTREIQPTGSSNINARIKDDSFNTENYKNVQSAYKNINRYQDTNTEYFLEDSKERDISNRLNPALLDSFRNNPYTQSLHSI